MSRNHTMFTQAQSLQWSRAHFLDAKGQVESRLLSRDTDTGAATALLRFPAGWSGMGLEVLRCQEELLVLDGCLQMGEQGLGPYSYACFPAGYARPEMRCDAGAVALVMFDVWPELDTAARAFDERKLVVKPNIFEQGLEAWTENPYSRYLMGTGVHPLREDPDTGEISILYAALPFRYMAKRWTHTHVQEMYVLSGEYAINDVGVMGPGAYAWWEPEYVHGPYGSLTGFMMFIRSVGGPLENIIEPELIAVDYQAPFQPVITGTPSEVPAPVTLPRNH